MIYFMEDTLSETRLTTWRTLITTHATLIEQIDSELIKAGCIPLHWYDVLVELWEEPQHRLRMHELASRVVLSRSTLTRFVDRLEREGLIVRERSVTDRRGAYAVLTEHGAAALRQAWPIYARGIANHFAHYLSDAEAEVITAALTRMLDALKGSSEE